MVRKREELLTGLRLLDYREDVIKLAGAYNQILKLPTRKAADVLHLAYASWYGMNVLLTWNCKHIASVNVRKALLMVNLRWGLKVPILGTPEELEA